MSTLKGLFLLSLGVCLGAAASMTVAKKASAGKRRQTYRDEDEYDEVNESSMESFPASDPPAWSKTPKNPDEYH
ncbi:MAG: hypothetical protein OM95_12315 [Bdellovibrio sp. ArHS]|uniref:hypothetical protein n=1 Tax=Bdellovibrio sp. ArHS TaxID=1569284 RepID=UPI000582D583|nr:hypothetical protein [Bdellovibrio sp. ArHS]KHD87791.1 MAG: hypothetical protein OM95_12315 [Bdellovibrio sp. ArHS]